MNKIYDICSQGLNREKSREKHTKEHKCQGKCLVTLQLFYSTLHPYCKMSKNKTLYSKRAKGQ